MRPDRLLCGALLLAATAARAAECVFYLRPSAAGYQARIYDPAREADRAAPVGPLPGPDMAWDWRFERLYWLSGAEIRRAAWRSRRRWERPIALPREIASPAAWWLDRDRLRLASRAEERLELWEYRPHQRAWRMLERQRLLDPKGPEPQAAAVLFGWTRGRRDEALAARLRALRADAYLGRIQATAGPQAGSALLPLLLVDGCRLKFSLERDAEGAHALAPVVLSRKGSERGRVIFDAPEEDAFARAAFGESGPWLLIGREAAMDRAKVLRSQDGSLLKALPDDASHATWVPCPGSVSE